MKPLPISRVVKNLAYTVLTLFLLGVLAHAWEFVSVASPVWSEVQESYIRLFRLDGEANIPTWFSSALLLLAALLAATVGAARRAEGKHHAGYWNGLAVVFVYLSVDEAAILHEMSVAPLREAFGTSGLLYYPWIVPALLALAVLGVIYTKFLLDLPPRTRRLMLLAGVVFVVGAAGMESMGGLFLAEGGADTPVSMIFEAMEELLEMGGVVLLVYALMAHLRDHEKPVRVVLV